jgi:hypothetical protein
MKFTLALLLVAANPLSAGFARNGLCDQLAVTPLIVSSERIGPYPASATLAELRTICPSAAATLGAGFESVWAALDLGIGDLTILAGQNWRYKAAFDSPQTADPLPEWESPASHWVIRGCGAELPSGVSSCGTWAELVAAFGLNGEGYAEFGPVLVSLEALPGFQLRLDTTDEVVGPIEVHQDLSRIPPTARIEEIVVVTGGAG